MRQRVIFFAIILILLLSFTASAKSWSDLNFDSGWGSDDDYRTNRYKETTEFKKTTEQEIKDDWYHESWKTTITEKTEYEREVKTPVYRYYPFYYFKDRYRYYPSSWRYKEPYSSWKARDKEDYYYKPRYDPYLGHYNWRW